MPASRQAQLGLPMQRPRQQRLFRPVLSREFPPSSAFSEEHHRRSQSTWQTRYYDNRSRLGKCRTFENLQQLLQFTGERQTKSDIQTSQLPVDG